MLTPTLIDRLETKILETIERAQQVFGREFHFPKIIYKDMGTTAGRAQYGTNTVWFSPTLFSQNVETYLARTVPHEIAHLVTDALYPFAKRHHGPEWKRVMQLLGVQDITRCHNYDVTSVANRRTGIRFLYACNCAGKQFEITTLIHKRIQGGQKRMCRKCKTLRFTGSYLTPY